MTQSVKYPMHSVPPFDPKNPHEMRTEHMMLMLPEQVGLKAPADWVGLFCTNCKTIVQATTKQYQQAQDAAQAEGVGAIVVGPPAGGRADRALPHEAPAAPPRRPGAAQGEPVEGARHIIADVTKDVETMLKKSTAAILRGTIDGVGLGYFVASASPDLTPAGESMAAQVADPDVPQMLPEDPAAFASYAAGLLADERKARRKSRAKVAVEVPMVCVCGHGPRDHLDAAGADRCCKTCGVVCASYRQAKPPKPEKKSKAVAKVAA